MNNILDEYGKLILIENDVDVFEAAANITGLNLNIFTDVQEMRIKSEEPPSKRRRLNGSVKPTVYPKKNISLASETSSVKAPSAVAQSWKWNQEEADREAIRLEEELAELTRPDGPAWRQLQKVRKNACRASMKRYFY